MELSNNVVSQFVKMTNDSQRPQQSNKIYGKAVIYEDKQYVQLDGSDLLTPADTTVHIKDGERVTVTINNHTATIDGNVTDISASNEQLVNVENDLVQFKVDTEGMFLTIRNEMNTKFAEFKVTVDGMFVNVNKQVSNLETRTASLEVTADQIQTEVNKKVGADQVGTIVTQNAESWNLSIDGKLKGTYYNFDGSSFTIGSSTGNGKAYHTSEYSKWTHSDGSWTKVDANGMTWSKGNTTSGYHCLLYAGEYTCASEQIVTITLPSEFKGKPFKVVTAIKRIYISEDQFATGCMFPLLSFYAECESVNHSNGTFTVYASIRAWNRTGYGGWGQLIGNGTTAGEREALKPVVAYWAFV